jgi:hypothetical protein
MKKVLTYLFAFTFSAVLFSSCTKEKPPTLQDKVTGKWLIETFDYNDHFSGMDHQYVMTGTPDEYMDFRKDGKLYYYFGGGHDTIAYTIKSPTEMTLEGNPGQIHILTDKTFKFYFRLDSGPDFEENTITLKR